MGTSWTRPSYSTARGARTYGDAAAGKGVFSGKPFARRKICSCIPSRKDRLISEPPACSDTAVKAGWEVLDVCLECRRAAFRPSALAFGYFCGSIPFGLLLTRSAGMGDVRAIGSGNIGATNVLRTGRKDLAAATLILDALKGTAAVLVARAVAGDDCALGGGDSARSSAISFRSGCAFAAARASRPSSAC